MKSNDEVDREERRHLVARRKLLRMDSVQPLDDLSALCLSGGGIRSAAFALGVIQGLAKRDLLHKFDYLSTVSGGGYIGSFLTAWVQRQGYERVVHELKGYSGAAAEASPLTHLRRYSRYLTPGPGVASTDMLTVVSIYIRNLILNWLMFLPFLILGLIFIKLLLFTVIFIEGSQQRGEIVSPLLAIAAVMLLGLSQLDSVLQRPG